MSAGGHDDVLAAEVLTALAAWQIPIVQFNGMVAERVGMGWTDLQALYVLANHGPATPTDLARRVNLTTGSASRMIDRLERAGFVRRVPDRQDRRRVLIEPLPAAVARVGSFYDQLNELHRHDLADMTHDELRTLARFMKAAAASTEAAIRSL
ncbi:MarR family transcriptional regulator [Pseudonocardia alaniniphila]|uniref:MarR family transcriptional regulator n=1 Tax=Pseudonocardia alaniniphila TaxID=75291 RepID=A0ABS9TER2_9PSEU|nr:MarR family transcriptional regulator [Pseudonocardia alaniniphila]